MSDCDCAVIVPDCPPFHRRYSPYCRMVDVSSAAPQVYFQVAPFVRKSLQTLTFNNDRVYMEVRRKGSECLIGTYNAWRRDLFGNIGFYFDDNLFNQPPGFFVGDVFIDCCYCFSVQLRSPGCEAFVLDCYTQPALETCGKGECGIMPAIGIGAIGGGSGCAVTSNCGSIAPYFPQDNLIIPTPTPVQPNVCNPVGSVIG